MKAKTLLAAVSLVLLSQLCAGNLLFNSSFELGDKGWTGYRASTFKSDGSYEYVGDAWTIDSKVAKFGVNSMRLENPEGSRRVLFGSHDFLVDTSKSYTVSFWARALAPCELELKMDSVQIDFRRDGKGRPLSDEGYKKGEFSAYKWISHGKTFKVDADWLRFSFEFTPGKSASAYAVNFSFQNAGPLWLDGIQVEEGKLTDYAPAAPVEAAVYAPAFVVDGKDVEVEVVAISYASDREDFILPLTLYDVYFGKELASRKLEMDLPKGKAKSCDIDFNLSRYGYFCVFTGVQPRVTPPDFADSAQFLESPKYSKLAADDKSYQASAFFVSVPAPQSVKGKGFRLGLTGNVDSSFAGVSYHNIHLDALGSPENAAAFCAASGTNTWRCWDNPIFRWKDVEPEKGRFAWEASDKYVELAEKAGIPLMTVLHFVDSNMKMANAIMPEWVRMRDRLGHPDGNVFPEMTPPWDAGNPSKIILPQLEDWREYVAAIANRYKGRIAYYEIFNEPNLWMPSKYYVEYLQVASEEIRKADPGAKIQGICSSTDRGGNLFGYIADCLKLGAGKYMDIMTVHPYCILDESNPSQMENRRTTLEALKKDGNNVKLWLGENYYLFPRFIMRDYLRLSTDFPADAISRFLLVDMGEGLVGSTPCHVSSFANVKCRPYQYYSSWQGRNTPNEKFAVHAACAHFVSGAEPLHTVALPAEGMAYVFKNGDRLLSSIWNSRCKQRLNIAITPPNGSAVAIYDVMANLIEKTDKAITLPLSSKPYYMEWEGADADAVRDALKSTLIKGEQPLAFKDATILKDKDSAKLLFAFENMSDKVIENVGMTLSSANFQEPVVLKIPRLDVFKEATGEVSVKLKEAKETGIATEYQGGKYTCNAAVKEIAAKVSSEPQEFKIGKCVIGKTPEAKDLAASFKMSSVKNILHLDVSVRDDIRGVSNAAPHEQDCIELFLDKTPFAAEAPVRQTMLPRKEGKFSVNGITGEITDAEGGYEASIDIPIGNLKFIGFDIAIDDSDASIRKTQLVWRGNAENHRNRDNLAIIQLGR